MGTLTTELIKLLKERDVEYEVYRDINDRCVTKWRIYHGAFVFFAVEKEGKLFVETSSDTEHSAICTPEQAIAITLGSELENELQNGTCRNQWQWKSGFCCSECFYTVPFVGKFVNSPFTYCPNCRRRVLEC